MKTIMIVMLCAAALMTAGSAQAYAIYNHVGYEVCVSTRWTPFTLKECKYTIPAHSTHNGGHGDSISDVHVFWDAHDTCYGNSDGINIPDGGYARIYKGEVKVYKHDGKRVNTVGVDKWHCGG